MWRHRLVILLASVIVASTPVATEPEAVAGPGEVRVNFQPEGAAVPVGYAADWGQAYDAARGYGWVAQDSPSPLSLVGNARDRNLVADQRLDTLIHMQLPPGSAGVAAPGRWEHAVAAGTYDITVSVGDPCCTNSVHRLAVEGAVAIEGFRPTSAQTSAAATVRVQVADGRVTLDAAGGSNTKLQYVHITPVSTGGATTFSWARMALFPTPLVEGQGAVVGAKLYVFSGWDNATFTPTRHTTAYDPVANTWQRRADMPQGVTHAAVAVDGTDVYLAGGYPEKAGGGQTFGSRNVWRYSTTADAWTAMPPLPLDRGSGALVRLGRNLHFFGGEDGTYRNARGDHWALALDGGTAWARSTSFPSPRTHMGYAALNGKIYAVGGREDYNRTLLATVYAWDPANPGSWTPAAPLPEPRSHVSDATFVHDGRIVVAGGDTPTSAAVASMVAYDPAANAWTQLSPLPEARASGVAGAIGRTIYYTTGSSRRDTFKGTPVD